MVNHGSRICGCMCSVLFSNQKKLSIFIVTLQNEHAFRSPLTTALQYADYSVISNEKD